MDAFIEKRGNPLITLPWWYMLPSLFFPASIYYMVTFDLISLTLLGIATFLYFQLRGNTAGRSLFINFYWLGLLILGVLTMMSKGCTDLAIFLFFITWMPIAHLSAE